MADPADDFLTNLAENDPELIERLVGRHLQNIEESGLDPGSTRSCGSRR